MAEKVTTDIVKSYLSCQYKAHLKLRSEQGVTSDYEEMLFVSRKELKQIAVEKILARHSVTEIPTEISLDFAALRAGPPFILDTTLEDDSFSLKYDALKRVKGRASAH
jgi:hypothetical protein